MFLFTHCAIHYLTGSGRVAILLTEERARELVQMPKKLLRPGEFAWRYNAPPRPAREGKRVRVANSRLLTARLIGIGTREVFVLTGNSNGRYGFTLEWREHKLTRIDSSPDHKNDDCDGVKGEVFNGPHVHYYVPGHKLDFAYATTGYDQSDVVSGLQFFLKLCNVHVAPDLQEVLTL
jgi:hypothetical protein